MPNCPNHPDVPMICPACIGATGGKVTSAAKTAACRENGKLGGRPKGSKNKPKS